MNYIFAGLFGGVALVALTFWYENGSLTDKVSKKSTTIALQKITIYDLNASLNEQNDAIDTIKVDYDTKIAEFKKLPKVKYVTKYITKEINATRSNCNDTKNLLFELRRIGID